MITLSVTDNRPKRNPSEYTLGVVDDITVREFSQEIGILAGDPFNVYDVDGRGLSADTKLSDKQSLIIDR